MHHQTNLEKAPHNPKLPFTAPATPIQIGLPIRNVNGWEKS
jgi:hypothetical protein